MIKILVAEDDRALNDLVCSMLRGNGMEAVAAFDGKQALDLFESESFDMVISDIMMPHTDGGEYTPCGQTHPYFIYDGVGR